MATVGQTVWALTGGRSCYELGVVQAVEQRGSTVYGVTVKLNSGATIEVKDSQVHSANKPQQDGVPDNTFMRELNEASLLHNIRSRYSSRDDGGMYTLTGHILIAVNPFRPLKIYEDRQIKQYLGRPIGAEPPHIYAIADRMYRLLVNSGESQARCQPQPDPPPAPALALRP